MALNSRILRNAKLNKFDLSHTYTSTCDMGYVLPVACIEVLPNDWFRIRDEFLARFLATLAPVMHIFDIELRWWFGPTRLVFDKWTDFITGGPDGNDSTVLPFITAPKEGFAVGSLMNRLGAPHSVPNIKVSALPVRLYNLIYNEFYRNEWLQDPVAISKDQGADTTTSVELLRACWERDYFTQAQPSPQKGPDVSLPLGSSAPVMEDGNLVVKSKGNNTSGVLSDIEGNLGVYAQGNYVTFQKTAGDALLAADSLKYKSGLKVDLSQASAVTINSLRYASAVQQFQEANALTGNRYPEFIPAQYGVYCPDASLQRPQYIGGMKSPMVISEVLQTSSTTSDSPQGNMAGHGVSAGVSPEIRFHAREFGYLMCLMTIRPKTAYFQGIPKFMSRETRYDYAIPIFAHIGSQAIRNKEIYATGTAKDEEVFGYTLRDDDYRFIPNMVTGQMTKTLDFWTAARKFAEAPKLNSKFVESDPTTRIFAVEDAQNSDHIVFQIAHHIKALRPLPKQGVPGMHII
ncbi:major capsid protein [Candidatus Avelusimicrobium fimicolum]|uniref:major capsid protein n=1 Tax=Candidatus Avelusimicrobium fimicolum TaxID=3416216 RepID=UPI003D1262A4